MRSFLDEPSIQTGWHTRVDNLPTRSTGEFWPGVLTYLLILMYFKSNPIQSFTHKKYWRVMRIHKMLCLIIIAWQRSQWLNIQFCKICACMSPPGPMAGKQNVVRSPEENVDRCQLQKMLYWILHKGTLSTYHEKNVAVLIKRKRRVVREFEGNVIIYIKKGLSAI